MDTLALKGWILIIHISPSRGKEINLMDNQFTKSLVILSAYGSPLWIGTPFAPLLGKECEKEKTRRQK